MNPIDTDARVTCTTCQHYRGAACQMAQAAGLSRTRARAEIGRDFATVAQTCSAHRPKENPK